MSDPLTDLAQRHDGPAMRAYTAVRDINRMMCSTVVPKRLADAVILEVAATVGRCGECLFDTSDDICLENVMRPPIEQHDSMHFGCTLFDRKEP